MDKRKILIQFDGDAQPSVFDRVVAIDAGADELFSYGGVRVEQVRDLIHGAIFTRGPKDLKSGSLTTYGFLEGCTHAERVLFPYPTLHQARFASYWFTLRVPRAQAIVKPFLALCLEAR